MHSLTEIEEYLRKKYSYETERKAYIYACCKFMINKSIEEYIKDDLVLRHEIMEEFRLKFKRSMELNGIQESWVDHQIELKDDKYKMSSFMTYPTPQQYSDLKEERIEAHAKAFGLWEEVCPDYLKARDIIEL